jgi:hypothetical protein
VVEKIMLELLGVWESGGLEVSVVEGKSLYIYKTGLKSAIPVRQSLIS